MSTKPTGTVVRTGSTTDVSVFAEGELDFARTGHLSAFDAGTCKHEFAYIGRLRTEFAVKFFNLLTAHGIPHHFLRRNTENSFIGRALRTMELSDDGVYSEVPTPANLSVGRLIPLEWIARREVATEGFLKRLADPNDPLTHARLQLDETVELKVGDTIPLFVECTTKLEPKKDRYLSLEEALTISGLTEAQFDAAYCLMKDVAELLFAQASKNNLRIKDFKLELGVTDNRGIIVADSLSPDELRMVDAAGRSLDKDLFRNWLIGRGFKKAVEQAHKEGTPLPSYPVIPDHISQSVSQGYAQAVKTFWRE